MKEIAVQIKFKEGLHARPAAKLAQQASAFESEVTIEKNGNEISAKNFIKIIGACIVYGDKIIIRADGTDENEAISAIEKYFSM